MGNQYFDDGLGRALYEVINKVIYCITRRECDKSK